MPQTGSWKRGYLQGVKRQQDSFRIKWTRKGFGRTLKGVWRVHHSSLFEGTNLLPVPRDPARVPAAPNKSQKEGSSMPPAKRPTKRTGGSTTKVSSKAKVKPAADNGAKRTRTDKLGHLSEAARRNAAKLIYRERSKSPSTSWPDIMEMLEDKGWPIPGSMTGRRLLREYGPDNAEDAIIKQDKTGSATPTKKKAPKKVASKKRAPVVEDEDEDEEELEEEELEEEDEDVEAEEDEDYEEEDEEEEEEEPEPPKAKKVRVTRGRGKKPNPSKK